MRRSLVLLAVCASVVSACTGDDTPPGTNPEPPSSSASLSRSPSNASTSGPPSSEPPATSSPSPTPDGAVLVEIAPDTPAREVDPAALAPTGSDVTGRWIGRAGEVDQVVVAVAADGDAFARDRALWRWTPAPALGGWLGVALLEYPARRGVLSLDAVVADVTGDRSDDVLAFALTGGSGACGAWSVVELASASRIYARDLCDGSVDPSTEPIGLVVTESVYRPGDPHCCPSARRESVLAYDDGGWVVARRETTPL